MKLKDERIYMKSYEYNSIFTPQEFQNFARDIIQIKENKFIESFAEGKDGGIDGRFIDQEGNITILQVKRYKNMNVTILNTMKEEKRKMDLLIKNGKRVDRYILVLSEDISVQKKDDILDIMSEYIKCSEDVIMKADLNNLLSMPKYKEIEDKYYQLWYPSTNILNRKLFDVVNGVLLQKSKMCYADMIEEKQIFVETSVYKEIISKVHKNKTVIISGEPGVGKTMYRIKDCQESQCIRGSK